MADPWDLTKYASSAQTRPPSTWGSGTKDKTALGGMTSYQSPSGNVRFDYVTPNTWRSEYGQASRAGADSVGDPIDWAGIFGGLNQTSGGGGGGGGGGARPVDYSAMSQWWQAARPKELQYTPLSLPEYQQVAPRAWDPSMYQQAQAGVTQGIADQRAMSGAAFDRMSQAYGQMGNPYAAGPQQMNPGVDPRLAQSMRAFGNAGAAQNQQAQYEAGQADNAMRYLYDTLGRSTNQYNQNMVNSVMGDRENLSQRLGAEERMLGLGVQMAQAKAKQAWDQEVWTLGKEAADRNWETRMQESMANWTRGNEVGDANVMQGNQWNSDIMNQVLQMIGSGGTGIPTAPAGVMI